MRWLRRLSWLVLVLALAGGGLYLYLPRLNGYQTEGRLALPGLKAPVTVTRDEKGMAYLQAQSIQDAVLAQGFVTAQDRIFQMQLTKMFVQGRLGEFVGEQARASDLLMRTLGLAELGTRQLAALDQEGQTFFQRYAQGVNAFLERCPGDLPLEFRLAGLKPEPWRAQDSLTLLLYMGYSSSSNLTHEVVAQGLLDALGPAQAAALMPLNLNPDDPQDQGRNQAPPPARAGAPRPDPAAWAELAACLAPGPLSLGSNNWATAPRFSAGGRPMLAGDPHLDARILPGIWYPVGLAWPGLRAVGANVAGLPGMAIGRTSHVAISITNNYGDMLDLYLERPDPADPGRYLEGEESLPFNVRRETLRFKDKQAPSGFREETLSVRSTRRGPLVNGLVPGLEAGRLVSLRWAPAERLAHDLGLLGVLSAGSARELDQLLSRVPMLCLNWVFADVEGNIGWRASGALPIRDNGGPWPQEVGSGRDNWRGWISPEEMPHGMNPQRGWLGTANHKVVGHDYPHYYSSFFAGSHRYRRMHELLDSPGLKSLDDHWRFQRDVKNLLAAQVVPAMAQALSEGQDTRDLAAFLAGWDYRETPDSVAATIFNLTWYNFGGLAQPQRLGPELTKLLVNDLYFWEERLARDARAGVYPPGLDGGELWRQAARQTRQQLQDQLGGQPADWRWGRVHYLELVSALRRQGPGKGLLGSGPLPMGGSAATLLRGRPDLDKGLAVAQFASLRMVADLADVDKVAAVLPGGICERLFSPHRTDQVRTFMDGGKLYWWLSQEALAAHARHTLELRPQ
ncbi:MAG: penicillin acylase family protein [Pseudomonadota bacterium]